MAFEGNEMISCPAEMYDFGHTSVIVVSGAGINACGHMLLAVGSGASTIYMHVAGGSGSSGDGWAEQSGLRATPKWMNQQGYRQYMAEAGKRELRRIAIRIPRPEGAMLKLEQLLAARWTWGVLPHNCTSFVEEIIQAGGNRGGLYLNCPAMASQSDFD
ncbi:hypothetical protein [Fibrella aquatica]|uniref:hypothetical protein n=1 Tax=Fibrella aquatica TaxID=3242487 RepID=UPI0035214055